MFNAIAHYPLFDVRPPFPNPDQLHFQVTLPFYILGMMFYGVEYPVGQLRSPAPAMLSPSFLCVPPHWQSTRQEKSP